MCIIIDANMAGRVFSVPHEKDFVPLWDWIEMKDGRLVFGGKLADELNKIEKVKRLLRRLWQAGKAVQIPSARIDAEDAKVRKTGLSTSNDSHVLALARASGARILCTNDKKLEIDFKNRSLVPAPKGTIYKKADHRRLLGHNRLCQSDKV